MLAWMETLRRHPHRKQLQCEFKYTHRTSSNAHILFLFFFHKHKIRFSKLQNPERHAAVAHSSTRYQRKREHVLLAVFSTAGGWAVKVHSTGFSPKVTRLENAGPVQTCGSTELIKQELLKEKPTSCSELLQTFIVKRLLETKVAWNLLHGKFTLDLYTWPTRTHTHTHAHTLTHTHTHYHTALNWFKGIVRHFGKYTDAVCNMSWEVLQSHSPQSCNNLLVLTTWGQHVYTLTS